MRASRCLSAPPSNSRGETGRARRGPDPTILWTGRWGQANQNLMGEARPKQPYVRRKTRITVG